MTAYLDNAATTRVCPEAAETAVRIMTEGYGNPSSTHALGREAKKRLGEARKQIAAALGCQPDTVYFTSGGTESDNWAILGGAKLMRRSCRHIVTTAIEHDAILQPMRRLEDKGWEVTYLKPDSTGAITAGQVAEAVREDTGLVSVMLVNNETGAVNPIRDIAIQLKRIRSKALLHTDAVQAFGKIPFTVRESGVDLCTVSGHKIHAPKGVGALYIRDGLRLPARLFGGGQEKTIRPGTEAMPSICAFGTAADHAMRALKADPDMFKKMRRHLITALSEKVPQAMIIGEGAGHIVSLSLPGYKSEVIMNLLDSEGIYVSKSSACKKGARSHVLEAMNLPPKVIDGAIRVSFSRYTTVDEIEYFVEKLAEAEGRLVHQ